MPNEIEPLIPTLRFLSHSSTMITKKWQHLNYLCLLLLNQATIYGVTSKHLHLKILVPDVINHHTHTRTVLLHVRVPTIQQPKRPRTYKKHEYSWGSSWSRGRYHNHRDEYGDHELDHENYQDEKSGNDSPRKEDDRKRQKYFPVYDYHKEYPSSYDGEGGNDLEERGRDSYAVHEDVNDTPPNTETVSFNYEEGYRKGGEVESGRIRADQTHKFHEDRREEQGDAESDGFKDEFETKTHAGRYLVDDVEYENTRDKRHHHGKRGRKRIRSVEEN